MIDLRADLETYLFGQQIVKEVVPAAIESSIDKLTPTKPLVLSFHGPTGVGKNFVVEFIVQNYFREGLSSKFYHHFESKIDFPYEEKYLEYQVDGISRIYLARNDRFRMIIISL